MLAFLSFLLAALAGPTLAIGSIWAIGKFVFPALNEGRVGTWFLAPLMVIEIPLFFALFFGPSIIFSAMAAGKPLGG